MTRQLAFVPVPLFLKTLQKQQNRDPPKESLLHKYKAKILYYQQFR